MNASNKTSAGLLPLIALVVVAVVLLIDWNVNGGFGPLSRIVAWVGGAVFVISLLVALIRTQRKDKAK